MKGRGCYTLVLNMGCFDGAVRLRAGSLCGVLIMLIRSALHAFEKYGRSQLSRDIETSRRGVVSLTFKIIYVFICFSLVEGCARKELRL